MLDGSGSRTLLTLLRDNLTRAGQASYLNTFHLKFSISIHFKGKLRTKFHYFFFCDQKPFMITGGRGWSGLASKCHFIE